MEMGLRQTILSDPQPGGGRRLAWKPGLHKRVSANHAGRLRARLPAVRTRKEGIGKALTFSDHGPRFTPPATREPGPSTRARPTPAPAKSVAAFFLCGWKFASATAWRPSLPSAAAVAARWEGWGSGNPAPGY